MLDCGEWRGYKEVRGEQHDRRGSYALTWSKCTPLWGNYVPSQVSMHKGRMDWEGEGQKLCSVQRAVAFGQGKLA